MKKVPLLKIVRQTRFFSEKPLLNKSDGVGSRPRLTWRKLSAAVRGLTCLSAKGVTEAAFTVTYAKAKVKCRTCSVNAPTAMVQVGCAQWMASGGTAD
jgi:hypothetical protein